MSAPSTGRAMDFQSGGHMQMIDRLCLRRLNLKTSRHGGVPLLDTRIVTHMTLDRANVNIVWNQLCDTRVRLTRHLYDKETEDVSSNG